MHTPPLLCFQESRSYFPLLPIKLLCSSADVVTCTSVPERIKDIFCIIIMKQSDGYKVKGDFMMY